MKSTCVLVTGANRGYGNAIAHAFTRTLDDCCVLIVHSRTGHVEMEKTECTIVELIGDLATDTVAKQIESMDLSQYKTGYLIHNAGSPGDCSAPILEQSLSADQFNEFFASNITQLIRISQTFLKKFDSRVCVNVSSLLALIRVPKCVMYSIAKAARDIAIENMGKWTLMFKKRDKSLNEALEDPNGFYLNWAPGPMPTRMFEYMKGTVVNDPKSTQADIDLWQNMTLIDLRTSAETMVKLVTSADRAQFNGKHVDFFDIDVDKL